MMRHLRLVCMAAVCTTAAFAQTTSQDAGENDASNKTPVAYVYVSNLLGNGDTAQVNAFAAAKNGKLTPVDGSPFPDNVTYMAVNGLYLFGSVAFGTDIAAYSIQSDGSLTYAATTSVLQPGNCDNAGALFLDHTGASLYNFDYDGNECANNTYQSFAIQKNTGQLTFLGYAGGSENLNGILSFTGNNQFAYISDCYHFGASISGFQRNSDGTLTMLNLNAPYPTAQAGQGWCPYLAAADPTNHLAIPMQPYEGYGAPAGPYQLATYTVDRSGNLTTTSTYANMPAVSVGDVNDVNMAPSGKLLAVGGANGLQVFNFNGAKPITAYTGLLTTDPIDQFFWDNNNNLYAISRSAGKLHVFKVTPKKYKEAPGSPYAISGAQSIIVQPWPLPWN